MRCSRAALCLTTFLLHAFAEAAAEQQGVSSFESFTQKYARNYQGGVAEYQERRSLFEARAAKVFAQNRLPHRRWTAVINAFADRTDDERLRVRGWRRRGSPGELPRHSHSSQAQPSAEESLSLSQLGPATPHVALPKSLSWAFLNSTKRHYNQGSCGSCWAIASTALLEAHSEIHSPEGRGRTFSAQELVSCVLNPKHCGGTGGCEGATIELAMDYTIKNGLAQDHEVPYSATDGECMAHNKAEGSSLLQLLDRGGVRSVVPTEEGADIVQLSSSPSSPGAQFGMLSWKRLPENKYQDLLHALQDGPVGISVAASNWFEYSHGIFDGCSKDAVIDHALLLIGYGADSGSDGYWLLKNSWGQEWGEHGMMRLQRRAGEAEDEGSWCGVDHQPELGSGCDGGPSEVKVCGTCGILYDTVVPHWRGPSDWAKKQAQTSGTQEY